jgi:exodeoxyribonuclease (lambda-induced)
MEQRSAEWYAARKGRVTASMVGAILGHSPYMTRDQAMRRMVRDAMGAEPEFTGNVATEYGTFHERGAIADFEMATGLKVQPGGWHTRDVWAGASPDGLIYDHTLIEVKCPYSLRNDPAPAFKALADQPHYLDQVQFQLWVTNRKACYFWQWAPNGTRSEVVYVDLDWQDKCLPVLRQFYAEYLAELKSPDRHLAPKRHEVDTPEAHRIMAEYDQISEAIDRAEERKKELLAEMVRLSGDKDAVFAGRNLTKIERQGSIAYAKAVAELLPGTNLEKWRGKASTYWVVK